jgi:hypothetical protein
VSDGLVRYAQPYPMMSEQPTPGSPCCRAMFRAWACTRVRDHQGQHEAGNAAGQVFASWPASGGEAS